ncbi:MAG TPA: HDOD domain-containing protein [Deltaproteobacteria bacterium]|nr:HDOD domain-containing protein [Deltaproteobacteria bacterium]
MKILVVDDELVSRKKMKMIMDGLGECEAVECGKDAIAAYHEAWEKWAPFDLITLDIFMPEMDGTEVLGAIRSIESEKHIPADKRVKIFMVTSQSDKETIINCVRAGCDDFITKPFDRETVFKKLKNGGFRDKIDAVRNAGERGSSGFSDRGDTNVGVLEGIISRFKRGDIDLPSLPQIHQKFSELVARGANLQEIAELLKQDAGISSKLISISNSSYYRGVVENKTLDQAIGRLGLETTRQTVNAISNRGLYAADSRKYLNIVEALWEHSLSCAYAAQIITETLNLKFSDDVFTMALFHDIGKLMLVRVVAEIEKKADKSSEIDSGSLFSTMDSYHGKTGSVLLKRWGFSNRYIQVAEHHDDISKAESLSDELKVIYCANILVKSIGYGQSEPVDTDLASDRIARELGLTGEKISSVREKVEAQMEELKQYLE